MTRKEIENISEIVNCLLDGSVIDPTRSKLNKRLKEVCDLAIKALEQYPDYPELSHSEISGLIYVYFRDEKFEITKQAIEAVKAIKALEQESCEDVVSRDAVIKAIDKHTFDTDDGLCLDDDISIILEDVSSVQPKTEPMRDFTEEEAKAYSKALDKMYKPIGFNVFNEDCISRKQAIYLADELKYDLPDNNKVADVVMAHNEGVLEYQTALSLLPSVQQEQKTDGDCISRQALLERIDEERKYLLELKMAGAEHIVVHHARRIIEDIPSVNPQAPKAGHWKRVTDKTGHLIWECDCGWQQRFATNFCPDCGSKNE